jgi:flavin reductase (DIM6/NTAB) family NADH-FMN oxidoreductase RutF
MTERPVDLGSEGGMREFRTALGRFTTGVTVITTLDAAGRPAGFTANSFSALSLAPPLVLWSMQRHLPSLKTFRVGAKYAVNVLAGDQSELAMRFARPAPDKFAGLPYEIGRGGCPVFDGCLARFEGHIQQCVDGGDHVILVGLVEWAAHRDGPPLLFSHGRLCVADALAAAA